MRHLTYRKISLRLAELEKKQPPFEVMDQLAEHFLLKVVLQEELQMLTSIEEKDKHIARLLEQLDVLSHMVETSIISNPDNHKKKTNLT